MAAGSPSGIGAIKKAQVVPTAAEQPAAWEPLHHDLHCDAGHPDHQCEVTLWRNGAANDTPPPLAVPRPAPVLTPPDVPRHHAPPALTATHLLGGVLAQSPLRGP